MNRQQFRDVIEQFYKDNLSLIDRKNADYAAGEDPFRNFRMAEYMGLSTEQGIMLRLLDKMARLANVSAKGGVMEVKDESLDDTLQDICNYTGILYAYRRSQS